MTRLGKKERLVNSLERKMKGGGGEEKVVTKELQHERY